MDDALALWSHLQQRPAPGQSTVDGKMCDGGRIIQNDSSKLYKHPILGPTPHFGVIFKKHLSYSRYCASLLALVLYRSSLTRHTKYNIQRIIECLFQTPQGRTVDAEFNETTSSFILPLPLTAGPEAGKGISSESIHYVSSPFPSNI